MLKRSMIKGSLNTHLIWKIRFELAIHRKIPLQIPVSTLSEDHHCPFGKWLHGMTTEDIKISGRNFYAVRDYHAEFHKISGKIQYLMDIGDFARARELLTKEFAMYSKALIGALENWMEMLPNEQHVLAIADNTTDIIQACVVSNGLYRDRFN